jgi:hypothetical protein
MGARPEGTRAFWVQPNAPLLKFLERMISQYATHQTGPKPEILTLAFSPFRMVLRYFAGKAPRGINTLSAPASQRAPDQISPPFLAAFAADTGETRSTLADNTKTLSFNIRHSPIQVDIQRSIKMNDCNVLVNLEWQIVSRFRWENPLPF